MFEDKSLFLSFFFFLHCGVVSIFSDIKANSYRNIMTYLVYSYSSRNILNKELCNIFIEGF